ncbi:hypothetical protein GCM10022409_01940 [Hymenobacter glaciei]|uniref:Carboxypeptidase-like regulatory domain-containing protein n=1 Tax=Hymenobacter glaciei TaxID=877209 RepID=A0ABP7T6Z6_9BACT
MQPSFSRLRFGWAPLLAFLWLALPTQAQAPAKAPWVITGQVVSSRDSSSVIPGVDVQIAGLGPLLSAPSATEGRFRVSVSDSVVRKYLPATIQISISKYGKKVSTQERTLALPVLAAGQARELPLGTLFVEYVDTLSTGGIVVVAQPALPWPMPPPTSVFPFPASYLAGLKTFRDVDDKLSSALTNAGYDTPKHYSIPDGFAVITRLEQTTADARPLPQAQRWLSNAVGGEQLMGLLRDLVITRKGYFRVMIFVVTPRNVTFSQKPLAQDRATTWYHQGPLFLDAAVGSQLCPPNCRVTALIYEFMKEDSLRALPTASCPITGCNHMVLARILPSSGCR